MHTITYLVIAASNVFEMPVDQIRSKSRNKDRVQVRWAVMAVAKEYGFTQEDIARRLDRDVSSVRHGLDAVKHGGVDMPDFDYNLNRLRVMAQRWREGRSA